MLQLRMPITPMGNPWLDIPLDDYEGHMSLPEVGQAQMIADQFDRAIMRWSPASIALIGCAGGNGLERIAAGTIERIVGVDVNPGYLEQTRVRHARRLQELELICADIQSDSLRYEPVDLTYAALLFEYVDVPATLKTLMRNSRRNAVLTAVLQLPHATLNTVSQSPYTSLGILASAMTLVSPEVFCHAALKAGFVIVDSATIELLSGKQFSVQNFKARLASFIFPNG
jgi:ubiquinone/menaquinone biosynthesis C-methylase UbiE